MEVSTDFAPRLPRGPYARTAYRWFCCVCLLVLGCAHSRNARPVAERPLPSTPQRDVAASQVDQTEVQQTSGEGIPSVSDKVPEKVIAAEGKAAQTPSDPPPVLAESKTESSPVEEPTSQPVPRVPAEGKEDAFQAAKQIVERAAKYYQGVEKYSCRITRQERVGRQLMPVEVMEMHFRRNPRSVYYKWTNEENAGRECVYVEGANNGDVITRGGKSDPFFMVGRSMPINPNGLLARSKSRYSITQSGLDNLTGRLLQVVQDIQAGKGNGYTVAYKGLVTRPEHTDKLQHVEQTIAKGADPLFPNGGIRHWFFDPSTGHMIVMEAFDKDGEKMEYYHFDRYFENDLIGDENFDPKRLWPEEPEKSSKGTKKTAAAEGQLPK